MSGGVVQNVGMADTAVLKGQLDLSSIPCHDRVLLEWEIPSCIPLAFRN